MLILLMAGYAALAGAQENIDTDEDSLFGPELSEDGPLGAAGSENDGLFGGGTFIEEVTAENAASGIDELFLVNEKPDIGGSYGFSMNETFVWNGDDAALENILNPSTEQFTAVVTANLGLDARPDEDFRFYMKANVSYPFEVVEDGISGARARSFSDIVTVREMFSDFNYKDKIFFRAGKSNINWGVGYMFSPADIVNIDPIDPEYPDKEREGPVSFMTQYPFGDNIAYAYAIADDIKSIRDLAFAAKGEFLLGTSELGIGAYYREGMPVYAMSTLTSSIGKIHIFAEAVGSYGTEKRFVEEVDVSAEHPFGLQTVQPEKLYFSGSAGFSWSFSDEDGYFNINLNGQYFYNGKGYADDSVLDNPGIPALIASGDLTGQDLTQTGRHYGGAGFGWRNLFNSDVSFSANWVGNLSDMSGRIVPSLSINLLDIFDVSLSVPVSYGEEGDEYSPLGSSIGASVNISMGGGSF